MRVSLLRHFVRQHRAFAVAVFAAALTLKILVPAGFMPVADRDGAISVRVCSGVQDGAMTMAMAMPMSDMPGGRSDRHPPVKAEMPCAFAGLAMPMLPGADPLLLAVEIAFVMALSCHVGPPVSPRRAPHLRPPLRGPPTIA